MLLGGRPQGGHEFVFEKVVCPSFCAHFCSRNVSARPGGGGPQFFPLLFPLIRVVGD